LRGEPMQTSIESFLFLNFAMDVILMTIVAKSAGTFRLYRIIAAASACTGAGFLSVLFPDQWYSPALQAIIPVPLSMLLCGTPDIRIWLPSAVAMAAGLLLSGGSKMIFAAKTSSRVSGTLSALCGVAILYLLLVHKKKLRDNWTINIRLNVQGASVCFPALIDTGNRLHEPLSGLPVIIAEFDTIRDVLPDTGYRDVAFGGLGGNGTLRCFRPDSIWIAEGKKMRRAPEAWVAVSPSPLPGENCALAPGEFASL